MHITTQCIEVFDYRHTGLEVFQLARISNS
jgi:hypothetical protein